MENREVPVVLVAEDLVEAVVLVAVVPGEDEH
jgi:hypothetical protein